MKNAGLSTRLLHENAFRDPVAGTHVSPIYHSSTFIFKDLETAIERNQHYDQAEGFTYARFATPSTDELERKIAGLEHGEAGIVFSSGMGAISCALTTALKQGDHLIAGKCIYGCTHTFITKVLSEYGVEYTLVDTSKPELIEQAMRPNTKVVYVETPSNPVLTISDIAAAAEIAHQHNALLFVDSTFASPAIQTPLDLGADVALQSATKYLSGHGFVVAGTLASTKEFVEQVRFPHLQCFGSSLAGIDAWLLMQGMKTLEVRMERHCSNAMKIARYLENHPMIAKVYYPGLESHPTHEIAKKQMRLYGGMMSFDVKGGFEAAKKFMNSTKIFSIGTSLGCVDSLIQHSPTMSHFGMTVEERQDNCIFDEQVRMSVGIENVEDLIADIDQALEQASKI